MSDQPFPRRVDVLVVGARCSGAATAMLLARRGARVLVIDQGHYGTDALSTHALMRGAVVQLQRWGLLPSLVAAGAPPIRRSVFHYGANAVEVPIGARHGIDALRAPRRTLLDRTLVDAARAAGADVRYETRLASLVRGPGGRVTGARVVAADGTVYEVAADLVIGADGRQSAVRRLVQAGMHRVGHVTTGTVYGHFSTPTRDAYEWLYAPRVSGGLIPTNGGCCAFVTVPADDFQLAPGVEPWFWRRWSDLHPAMADALRHWPIQTRLKGFSGLPGFIAHAAGPGWALVGDAGYFRDPLTAHGITDAFLHAEWLAEAVLTGTDQALDDYDRRRVALVSPVFDATEAIASFSWTLDTLPAQHTALSKAMSRSFEATREMHGRERVLAARPL